MTINLLRGKGSRGAKNPELSDAAIGEPDASVFNCPVCSRPLSNGTAKCPACGTRLIMGLRMTQAGGILALGVAIGVAIGVALTAILISVSIREPSVPAAAVPTAPPAAVSTTVPVGPGGVTNTGLPTMAMAALSGTAVVNGRITVDAATLRTTLASKASTSDLARALRSLAADAALGSDLTGRLTRWTDAAPVAAQLDAFYRSMAKTARDGLRYSLSDNGAYRSTAADMLKVLTGLNAVDAASRTLAATVSLELPPVGAPAP